MKAKSKPTNVLDVLLAEPTNVQDLIDKLDFSEENIIPANREQAELFLEASRYRVKRMRARIQAEAEFESEKANAALYLRAKKKEAPKGAFTEAYIRDKIQIHPAVVEARKKYDRCQVFEEWAKLLLEAYRQRGHTIKNVGELLGAEAVAQARLAHKELQEAGMDRLRSTVRKKYPGRRD